MTSAKVPVRKMDHITIQKYKYFGWNRDTANPGEIIYVDIRNKHPDPMKKLLWGRRQNGQMAKGDFLRFFAKVGKPVTIKFRQTGRYAMEENMVRIDAFIKAIKSGKV